MNITPVVKDTTILGRLHAIGKPVWLQLEIVYPELVKMDRRCRDKTQELYQDLIDYLHGKKCFLNSSLGVYLNS